MKTLQKVVSLILILVVFLSLFGCGSGNDSQTTQNSSSTVDTQESTETLQKSPVTFTVLANGISKERLSTEDEIGQIIKEKFNVEFKFVPFSETPQDRATMMLAANDWGDLDLVTTGNVDVTKKYIDAGAFIKLDDYLKSAPAFAEYCKDLIPYWRNYDSKNGDLYVWQNGPEQSGLTALPLDICTRVDVLEEMGWPKLETTDDYIAFLKEAMKKFPTTLGMKSIGMIGFFGETYGPLLASYLPRESGYQEFYKTTGMIDPSISKIIAKVGHPYFKETMRFWNILSREGTLDKEIWNDKQASYTNKFESGVALTAYFASWLIPSANAKLAEAGHPEINYIMTPLRLSIAEKEGKNNVYAAYTATRVDDTTGILKQCKDPDRLMEVINFLASEEMTIRAGWGVKDRDYTIRDGLRYPTDDFLQITKKGDPDKVLDKRGIGPFYGNHFPMRLSAIDKNKQANMYMASAEFINATSTDTQIKAFNQYGWNTNLDAWINNPNYEFVPFDITPYLTATTLDPSTDIAKTEEKLIQLIDQQIVLIINAKTEEEFEARYNETVKKAEDLGLQKVIDKYNEQLVEIEVHE